MPLKVRGRHYLVGQGLQDNTVTAGGDSNSHVLNISRNTVAYTDTTDKELFIIPASAVVVGITVDVTTAFNDSGTDLLDLGKSGTTTHFVDDLSVTATGQTVTGWSNFGTIGASAVTAVGLYAGQNADSTEGEASVTMFWFHA